MSDSNGCSNLVYLSAIACKLTECLTEEELAVLSADMVVFGDMLANLLAHKALCKKEVEKIS